MLIKNRKIATAFVTNMETRTIILRVCGGALTYLMIVQVIWIKMNFVREGKKIFPRGLSQIYHNRTKTHWTL